ncbi:MAG: HU family DNA-binding protein, partial [Prevotella sp.]|nr:HU family DNA-binding protein [Prevotella sp.]
MATIKDIARLLVDKHKMTLGASEEFVQKIVEVINEGLLQDRIVKIKGFGTFKLQEVKERSSVNINTGEKVVIAAHDKITFTPDSVMRDMVNKPFAHFETVLVGDN